MSILFDDLKALIARRETVCFVGEEVSVLSVSPEQRDLAAWTGLLRSGVQRCLDLGLPLSRRWAERQIEAIESGDADELLGASEQIAAKLKSTAEGEFGRWLRESVGTLGVSDPSLLTAIKDLGLPVVTTNYDGLLEGITGLPAVTWQDGAAVERVLRGDEGGIIHLHGYYRRPESIVLGIRSRENLRANEHAQAVLRAIRTMRSLFFIGFGRELTSPNFTSLLAWSREVFSEAHYRHFRLVLNRDVAETKKEHPGGERVFVLGYGDDPSELAPFLISLVPEPAVSAAPAAGAVVGEPHPRVLAAGPFFGVPEAARNRLMEAWNTSRKDEEALSQLRYLLDRNPEIDGAHIASIARYEAILDFSPWNAFSRYVSIGFTETTSATPVSGTPVLLSPRDNPRFFSGLESATASQLRTLLAQGLDVSGFGSQEHPGFKAFLESEQGIRLRSDSGPKVEGRPCQTSQAPLDSPAVSISLDDYRRALRVVAGQVRLPGEDQDRVLQDVFVDMELRREADTTRTVPRALRTTDESLLKLDVVGLGGTGGALFSSLLSELRHNAPDAGEFEEELSRRERRWLGEVGRKEESPSLPASQVLSLGTRVLLTGSAGSGKSTLLRWLATQAAGTRAAVWLPLSGWLPSGKTDLADTLACLALRSVHLPETALPARYQLRELIEQGLALLLVDGLDELAPGEQRFLLHENAGLKSLHAGNQLLVSSRPILKSSPGAPFIQAELSGLKSGHARIFLMRYFGDAAWIRDLIKDLRKLAAAEEWQRIPVLLTLAAYLYRKDQRLPQATLELYERVVTSLLRWGQKRVGVDQITVEKALQELSDLARGMLVPVQGSRRVAVRRSEVSALEHDDIILASGLLAGGKWLRFTHLTIGEYLAARGLRDSASTFADQRGDFKSDSEAWRQETLPMAHALAPPSEMEAAFLESANDAPDHRMLALVLRALAYGGERVLSFVKEHGAEVFDRVLDRMECDSAVFGDEEVRLAEAARRAVLAIRGIRTRARDGVSRVIESVKEGSETDPELLAENTKQLVDRLLGVVRLGRTTQIVKMASRRGAVAREAAILGWTSGAIPPIRPREDDPRRASVVALALLEASGKPSDVLSSLAGGHGLGDRRAAVSVLGADPEARPLLRDLLKDSHPFVRRAAASALGGDPEARPLLRDLLKDSDSFVRSAAATALGADPEARPLLRDLLKDSDPYVGSDAASALGGDPEARAVLRELLRDSDPLVRRAAASALGGDPEARPLLRDLLKDAHPYVRSEAASALDGDPEARAVLRELLRDSDSDVRRAAASALGADPEARAVLRELLKDSRPFVRRAAASALDGDPEARPFLRDLLRDSDSDVRRAAASALGADPEARPFLLDLLKDWDSDVRRAAASALGGDPEARPLLRDLLKDAHPYVRRAAASALGGDPEARPLLRDLLKDSDSFVRSEAALALGGDPEARPLLRDLLKDADGRVRSAAASALGADPEARPLLRDLLKDSDSFVRRAAASALGADPEARAVLRELLKDSASFVRRAAASALGGDPEARSLLRSLLKDSDSDVRRAAASALGGDPEARAVLRELLRDSDSDVRSAAASALGGDPEARPLLRDLLKDAHSDVRSEAASALGGDPEARAVLRDLLKDSASFVRRAAASALGGDPEARPLLRDLLKDWDSDVRSAAASALGGDPEARPLLRDLLKDAHPYVRRAAASALGGDPEARPLLRDLLKDADPYVRSAAASALGGDPESLPLLRDLLKDSDPLVRGAAASALGGDPEARPLLRDLLRDSESSVRSAAASALGAGASDRVESLSYIQAGEAIEQSGLSRNRAALHDWLQAFVSRPSPLSLSNPALGLTIKNWLIQRLCWSSPNGDMTDGRAFGEVRHGQTPLTEAEYVLIRVRMDDGRLPRERDLHPVHNLLEAWRVAKHLRSPRPFTLWLGCADVPFDDLMPPELEPGTFHWGPTFFGFRLAEEQTHPPTLVDLVVSSRAVVEPDEALKNQLFEELSRRSLDPSAEMCALLPALEVFGARLPQSIQQAFSERLGLLTPLDLTQQLQRTREALGTSSSPQATVPTSELNGTLRLAHLLESTRSLIDQKKAASEIIDTLSNALPLLKTEQEVDVWCDLADRCRYRFSVREEAIRLRELLGQLATRPEVGTRAQARDIVGRIQHLIGQYLKGRR